MMAPLLTGIIGLLVLLGLLVIGVPVAFSMLLVGFFGLVFIEGLDVTLALTGSTAYHGLANWLYVAIPMFVLMGEFAGRSGILADLFSFFRTWLGGVRGSLAFITILTSALFSFATGSTLAATAVMGKLVLPEMQKGNYEEKLSLGTVLAGGTLGNIIPPSIGLVLFGIITEVSIGKLLVGAIFPGLLVALLFVLWIAFAVRRNPEVVPPSVPTLWKAKLSSLRKTWGMLLVITSIFGSIYTGVATITEAATVGCFLTFLIALSKKMSPRAFHESLVSTALLSGMIFLLLIGVVLFTRFLTFCGFATAFVEATTGAAVSPWLILGLIYFAFLVLGCIVDPVSLLLLTIPIVFPVVVGLGFDPIWFGVMAIVMMQIGMITPPVGMALYVLQGVSNAPFERCVASALPPLVAWLVLVALLTAFPSIATWLPSTM